MGNHIVLTSSDGHAFDAYRAEPDGVPRAGLVVLQEIFGVNGHIRSVTDRFAELGFLAVAPALFDRVERGVELAYDDAGIARGRDIARGRLDYTTTMTDVRAAALSVSSAGRVGVVGYCWGGLLATLAAIELADVIDAAVGYYGGGIVDLVERAPKVPLMLHFGEHDHAIPLVEVDRIRAAWTSAVVHVYDGAAHGFNCDQRASYHAAASDQALRRTLDFFATLPESGGGG